jgi:hypothetical protein
MTSALQPLAASFHTTNTILEMSLSDLNESAASKRVRNGEGPSIAWEVDHMLEFRREVLSLLGVPGERAHGANPSPGEYGEQWKRVAADLDGAIEAATEESLRRSPGEGVHGERTVLDRIVFLAWHEAYHAGALGGIRKELGYPGAAELVLARAAA